MMGEGNGVGWRCNDVESDAGFALGWSAPLLEGVVVGG